MKTTRTLCQGLGLSLLVAAGAWTADASSSVEYRQIDAAAPQPIESSGPTTPVLAERSAQLGLPVADPMCGGPEFEELVDACLSRKANRS